MNASPRRFGDRASQLALSSLIAVIAVASTRGADAPIKAEVRGLLGRAQVSSAGGAFATLKGGAAVREGDVLQTASGSAVDLYLGPGVGTVRLTAGTTVAMARLVETDDGLDVELTLKDGELLGKDLRVTPGSRLVIRNAAGFGAVVSGHFRFGAKGHVVLMEGKVIFVQIPAGGGEPVAHTINAPPAVYWSPSEGIKPAPPALVREVNNQTRSKLPKR